MALPATMIPQRRQDILGVSGGNWPIDGRQIENEPLHFPYETLAILNPFRKRVITYIFLTARGLSQGRLDSAEVSISSISDQDAVFALDLTLTIDADWTFIKRLRRNVLGKVSEWSEEWSDDEKREYGERIYFGILPRSL